MKYLRLITRRRVKWAGTILALSSVVLLSSSMLGTILYSRVNGDAGVKRSYEMRQGAIVCRTIDIAGFVRQYNSLHLDRMQTPESGYEFSVEYLPTTALLLKPYAWKVGHFSVISVPLWPIMVLLAAPTAYLWYTDRRAKPWQCPRCRYDLRGPDGGVCPECGAKNAVGSNH